MDKSRGVDRRAIARGRTETNPQRRGNRGFIEPVPQPPHHAENPNVARNVELNLQQHFTLNVFCPRLGRVRRTRF